MSGNTRKLQELQRLREQYEEGEEALKRWIESMDDWYLNNRKGPAFSLDGTRRRGNYQSIESWTDLEKITHAEKLRRQKELMSRINTLVDELGLKQGSTEPRKKAQAKRRSKS